MVRRHVYSDNRRESFIAIRKQSVKVLSQPGPGIQVQVESKATGLSVGS